LTPIFDGDFHETAGEQFTTMLHGLNGHQTVKRRRIRMILRGVSPDEYQTSISRADSQKPSGFEAANAHGPIVIPRDPMRLSTEQNFLKKRENRGVHLRNRYQIPTITRNNTTPIPTTITVLISVVSSAM